MKLLVILVLFLFSIESNAQPEAINYQGVARDSSGHALVNQNISLRLSILNNSNSGPIVYNETHSITTNTSGLFNINIGNGNVLSGTFGNIQWNQGYKWLKIEMDPSGGNNFQLIGTTQFLSVPYSLHSETANKLSEKNYHIGDSLAGGIIFYLDGSKQHGLVCSMYDLDSAQWATGNFATYAHADCIGAGLLNTKIITRTCGNGIYAAKIASDYSAGGFHDWYLPCITELQIIYENLIINGLGNFQGQFYWSSNDDVPQFGLAWVLNLNYGEIIQHSKTGGTNPTGIVRVRPIRQF